jgi:chromosome partitioning protein
MTRLAVFNSKGGVGKSTTVLNLAAAATRAERSPFVIDLDPQAHLTRVQGELPRDVNESLFAFFQDSRSLAALARPWQGVGRFVPAHGQLVKVDVIYGKGPAILNKLRIGLDSQVPRHPQAPVIVDCCPYVGVLALNAVFAADSVLIPVSTDYLSLQAAVQMSRALQALEPVLKRRMPRAYVLTRFDRRRRMSADVMAQLKATFPGEVCATVINENVAVAESPAMRRDVFSHQPASQGAVDYRALYDELCGRGML